MKNKTIKHVGIKEARYRLRMTKTELRRRLQAEGVIISLAQLDKIENRPETICPIMGLTRFMDKIGPVVEKVLFPYIDKDQLFKNILTP